MSTVQDGPLTGANGNGKKARAPGKAGKSSGAEAAKLSKLIAIRYSLQEYAALKNKAQRAGLSVSAFVRLEASGIKPRRKTTPDQRLAVRYLAELGKIGSNLNQLARCANMNQAGAQEIDAARQEIAALGKQLRSILRG